MTEFSVKDSSFENYIFNVLVLNALRKGTGDLFLE